MWSRVGLAFLKNPEKLLNCQRSVSLKWVGKIATHVNPLKCLTLCAVSTFGWKEKEGLAGGRGTMGEEVCFLTCGRFEVTLNACLFCVCVCL